MALLVSLFRFLLRCLEGLGIFLLRLASIGVACAFEGVERISRLTPKSKYRNRKGFSPALSVLPQIERSLYKRKSQRSSHGHTILVILSIAITLIWILFH